MKKASLSTSLFSAALSDCWRRENTPAAECHSSRLWGTQQPRRCSRHRCSLTHLQTEWRQRNVYTSGWCCSIDSLPISSKQSTPP